MKKSAFLLATTVLLALFTNAQKYKDISDKVLLKKYKDAKEDLDKGMSNAKFTAKPDAYILKTAIYAAIASDTTVADRAQLTTDAQAAFAKYREMDAPNYELMKDLVYKEGPINLYTVLFNDGYKEYRVSNWEKAAAKFKSVVDISDFLASKQLLNSAFDTTAYILAAYTAENANHKDEAAKYYMKLADNKVAGPSNEFIYRFLVVNSFQNKDMANFEKYKALGKEFYPTSEYFTYDKTDFAFGLSENFNTKLNSLEEVLAKDPNDYKTNVTLAQLLYDTIHPRGEGVPPANSAEYETKMINALNKAAAAKPDDETVYLVMGDHFIDKADKLNDARSAFVEDMKKRTKPGTAPAKADLAKRDDLDKQYGDAFDKAREPYEKAAEIMSKKGSMTASQKQQYRKVAGYLGDIYNFKRAQAAKTSPAEAAKYEASAKKWNDLYDTLKQ